MGDAMLWKTDHGRPIMHVGPRHATYHDGLEHLVAYTGQHPLVHVQPDLGKDLGQLGLDRPREHAQGDVHVLQVLGPRDRVDDARPAPHVEEVRRLCFEGVGVDGVRICTRRKGNAHRGMWDKEGTDLEDGDDDAGPLLQRLLQHAVEAVKHHGAEAALHCRGKCGRCKVSRRGSEEVDADV